MLPSVRDRFPWEVMDTDPETPLFRGDPVDPPRRMCQGSDDDTGTRPIPPFRTMRAPAGQGRGAP